MTARSKKLLLWTLPLMILLLAFAGFMITVWVMGKNAAGSYASQNYDAASESYDRQYSLTRIFPETWRAPYNQGTTLVATGEYDDAVGPLEEALELVPATTPDENGLPDPWTPECYVRTNLSIAYEGQGDLAAEDGDKDAADELYIQALDMIGPCSSNGESESEATEEPTPEAENFQDDVEVRQWRKLNQEESDGGDGGGDQQNNGGQDQNNDGGGDDQQNNDDQGGEQETQPPQDPRLDELEQRNQDAGSEIGTGGTGSGTGQNW